MRRSKAKLAAAKKRRALAAAEERRALAAAEERRALAADEARRELARDDKLLDRARDEAARYLTRVIMAALAKAPLSPALRSLARAIGVDPSTEDLPRARAVDTCLECPHCHELSLP